MVGRPIAPVSVTTPSVSDASVTIVSARKFK